MIGVGLAQLALDVGEIRGIASNQISPFVRPAVCRERVSGTVWCVGTRRQPPIARPALSPPSPYAARSLAICQFATTPHHHLLSSPLHSPPSIPALSSSEHHTLDTRPDSNPPACRRLDRFAHRHRSRQRATKTRQRPNTLPSRSATPDRHRRSPAPTSPSPSHLQSPSPAALHNVAGRLPDSLRQESC